MIRERHNIDNELIINFLENNKFNRSVQKSLLDWYALLEEKDFKKNREKAIEFIKGIAEDVLLEVEFSKTDKDKLIGVFEPLETILRTAQSLNTEHPISLRDHLSHTIRVLLFANYLFHEYYKINVNETKTKREVFIAAIFHDMAYPIQKIKEIGNNLSEGTFKELLNSSGKIEFSLDNPKDLLELMNFWGLLPSKLEEEYKKEYRDNPLLYKEEKRRIINKVKHIYKEILTPAIAGQGLFNTKHNLSSVVLFLRPILKEWKHSETYLRKKIETICDICLAIAYHDRSLPIDNFTKEEYQSEIPRSVKILRIADELQEWDRTRKEEAYTENVTFETSSEIFCVSFTQKDSVIKNGKKSKTKKCNPCFFIPDKIEGLLPIINSNSMRLEFNLPETAEIDNFKITDSTGTEKCIEDILKEKYNVSLSKDIANENKVDRIHLLFKDKEVSVSFMHEYKAVKVINCKIPEDGKPKEEADNPSGVHESSFLHELSIFRKKLNTVLGKEIPTTIEDAIRDDIAEVFRTAPLLTLQGRKQLGLLHKVKPEWNTVGHTRYQHSMGVTAKCIVVCDYLNSINPELSLTIQDVKELALAAALHDCGHLPMSHAVERAFLSSKFNKSEVTHEARIIPLLLRPNPYFEDLHNLIKKWTLEEKDFDKESIYRVAAIISPEKASKYLNHNAKLYPKRAISQLLSSEIDLDRLDFVIRDAKALKYSPVTLIEDEILKFIGGLTLVKANTLHKGFEEDIELCVEENKLKYVFHFLVCRVLLYKYCYFSKEVRSFEAILTYLINYFLECDIAIEPLKLIAMSDTYFIERYLEELLEYIPKAGMKEHYRTKYINVLKKDKIERFKFSESIEHSAIKNPRLARELEENLNKHSYIDTIKNSIIEKAHQEDRTIENTDLLFDVFALKTGGGDLLVSKNGKLDTLKNYMNGSNIHRLCTETRLDIYYKSDIGENKKEHIRKFIKQYYGYRD